MDEPRQIFRNTAVLAVSRIIDRATGVFVALFVARVLGPSGLGIYVTAIAYYAIIAMAGEMGSTNLIIRDIARARDQTSRYVTHLSAMAIGLSLVVIVLFSAVLSQIGYTPELKTSLLVIIAAIVPGTLNTIQEAVFVAHQRVEFDTMVTACSSVVNAVGSLVLLKTGHGVVSIVVLFVVLQYAVAVVYFLIINRYIAKLRWHFELGFAWKLARDLKAFAGSSVINAVFARAEIVLLSLVSSPAQVGFYGAAYKLVDLCYFIPQTFMVNVYPVLSRSYSDPHGKPQAIQDRALKYLLAISLPLTAALLALTQPLIERTVGEQFNPAVTPLRILSLTLGLTCLQAVLWRVLAARGEAGAVLQAQVITAGTRLASGYPLISAFGAVGAAVTTAGNLLVQTILLARSVRRDGTRIRLAELSWRFTVAAAVMGAVSWICVRNSGGALWLAVPAGLASYVLLVVLLKGFTAADYALFRRVVPLRLATPGSSGGAG